MSLATADGATRRFGDVLAVHGVDLDVGRGEVVGLLGANGAGKTTLIRLLLGLVRPTAGNVALFGELPEATARRRLGYVPQGLGLYDDLTLAENLSFAAAAFGHREVTLDDDLEAARDTLVRDLPLGLQRRAAFAQALAHDPELLVLDEPTSGVDPLARARLWDTIRDASEHGSGVLVTTHHMEEAEHCDRLVVMAAGRVVAEGTMEEIVGSAKVVEVTSDHWDQTFSTLEQAGLQVSLVGKKLRVVDTTLDDVEDALAGTGARAEVVPATFEERFVSLTSREIDG